MAERKFGSSFWALFIDFFSLIGVGVSVILFLSADDVHLGPMGQRLIYGILIVTMVALFVLGNAVERVERRLGEIDDHLMPEKPTPDDDDHDHDH